jgi:hypothetical protein
MEEVSLGLMPIKGDRGFSEDIKKIQLLIKSGKFSIQALDPSNPFF